MEETNKLIWLDNEETLKRYLFAQCFGNVVGQAYLFGLQTKSEVNIDSLVDFSLKCADVAANKLKDSTNAIKTD